MLINRSNVETVFTNLRTTFNQAFQATETQYQNYATLLDTQQITEQMDWIGDLPNWREWVGDKQIQALAAHTYALTCVPWESTFAVSRRDLEADKLGIYAIKARAAGEQAAYFPEERVAEAANASFTATCWDGKPFFATDHPTEDKNGNAATYSNKGTAALSASTQAAAIASLGAGLTALQTMKNTKGRLIRVNNIRLVVPPALRDVANILATNERLEDGKQNPYRGLTVDVWPELTNAAAWFLFGASSGLKPFILLQRQKPTAKHVVDPSDSRVFMTGNYLFGMEADAIAGYTFPQLAYGSTGGS